MRAGACTSHASRSLGAGVAIGCGLLAVWVLGTELSSLCLFLAAVLSLHPLCLLLLSVVVVVLSST